MRNLTIKFRLCFVMGLLALLLVATGAAGLFGLKNNNDIFRAVYDDRLVALGQLDNVIRAILRNQIELSNASNGGVAQIPVHLKTIEENLKQSEAEWSAYTGSHIVPQESELFSRFVEARRQYHENGFAPALKLLREQDLKGAQALASGPVYELYQTLRSIMNDLIQMQLDLGHDEYVKAQNNYGSFKTFALLAMASGLLIAFGMGIWLIRSISHPLREAVRIANAITGGDLTQQIEVRSTNETGKLLAALREMHGSLQNIVGQVRTGTDTIATATAEIATGNMDLSLRTEQQASSLEKTASAMEELTSTVKQNSDNARQANQLVLSASDVASRGGAVVTQVMATMTSIDEAARKIVNIIAVIDSIAFQTNILALNAAVEAARAGAQGRGFAVVATEVRNLARRSAEAAKEIKILINDTVHRVGQGNELVQQAGSTMDEILSSVQRVTAIMSEIAVASDEQDAGIGQIGLAVVEIDSSTQQNAALVEQAAAAASSLKEQAYALAQLVSVFKLERPAPAVVRQTGQTLIASAPAGLPAPSAAITATDAGRGRLPDLRTAPARGQRKQSDAAEQWEEF